MSASQPLVVIEDACWQRIGVWGDRTCPELLQTTHCHNCPVFSAAGRKFLDGPTPANYLDEWTARLAPPDNDSAGAGIGVLVFRIADEWFGLAVDVLVEVTHPRPTHRIPHRGGFLAGLVNIRGELHLLTRLDLVLGITEPAETVSSKPRLVVIRQNGHGWVFRADEVDQVQRIPTRELTPAPPTLARATARFTRGVFALGNRTVGLLDETHILQALGENIR